MDEAIRDYCRAFAAYDGGTAYGQSGNDPACTLPAALGEQVRGAFRRGKRAGLARSRGDEGLAQFEREHHAKSRPSARAAGLDNALQDWCYDLGYREGYGNGKA